MADCAEFAIEYLDPRSLEPAPQNFRRHPDAQRVALGQSLTENGWLAAPIINKRGGRLRILDGHARVELAVSSEERLIPVRVIDVSEAQEKRILASFDRIGDLASPDDGALAALLSELAESEAGLPPGWGQADLDALLSELAESPGGLLPGADPDALPEEVETRVKTGELWRIGEHRLLCGDSRNGDDVGRLMLKESASLLFTSPPYLHQRDYGAPIGDWNDLMCGVFMHVPIDDGQILVNLGLVHEDGERVPYWDRWIEWMRESGWRRFGFYVWDQGHGLPGDWNGRLAPCHEFIFHFNRQSLRPHKTKQSKHAGEQYHGSGLRQKDGSQSEWSQPGGVVQPTKIPDSVLRVTRHMARGIEVQAPAVMACGLAVEVIEAFSLAGDGVYDPFAGSGTTLIACEQTGRAARCIEIEPRYVDVCLARWEQATGKSAERLG